MQKKRQIGPFRASKESFVPHMRRGQVCRESFVPKRQGVVVVGRIMPCSGVVLVPVGRLWRRPGAAHAHCGRALRAPRRSPRRWQWGFCTTPSLLAASRRRVEPSCSDIPPVKGPAWRARRPKRRLPRTKHPKSTHFHRSGLRFGRTSVWQWCGIRTRATPPPLRSNVARNSPTTASQVELPSLELQRLQAISKSDRIKLCATFERGHP